MASPQSFPGGLGLAGTVFADVPATLKGSPAYFSGAIQWLDTINGVDGALPAGSLPETPVKTLAQAVTNSAANGIIIIGAGSYESLAGSQTIAIAGLSIFGCGSGSSRPRYTAAGAVEMWNISAAGVWVENIYFPASTVAPTSRITSGADGQVFKDCYFECGANDTNRALYLSGGSNVRVEGCSFVVTASRPAVGIAVPNSTTDIQIIDCVFDGGSYGWSAGALAVSNGATRIRINNPTLSHGSDIIFSVTGTSYQIFGIEATGSSNVYLTA